MKYQIIIIMYVCMSLLLQQQMHAQQLGPAAAAAAAAHPPLPMLPHPGLPGAPGLPPSSAASLLGLSGLGGPHPLAILNAKHELHRDEKPPG